MRRAASRADCTAGKSRPTKMPMIAMTTSNSTRVNAERVSRMMLWFRLNDCLFSFSSGRCARSQFRSGFGSARESEICTREDPQPKRDRHTYL